MCTHHICNMYNIHNICTTLVSHIQKNLASSFLSMLILARRRPHCFHFVDVSLSITCSYHKHRHNTSMEYKFIFTWYWRHIFFITTIPTWFLIAKNFFMLFACIGNHSTTRTILDDFSNNDIDTWIHTYIYVNISINNHDPVRQHYAYIHIYT